MLEEKLLRLTMRNSDKVVKQVREAMAQRAQKGNVVQMAEYVKQETPEEPKEEAPKEPEQKAAPEEFVNPRITELVEQTAEAMNKVTDKKYVFKGFGWLLKESTDEEFNEATAEVEALTKVVKYTTYIRKFLRELTPGNMVAEELDDVDVYCTKAAKVLTPYTGHGISKKAYSELMDIHGLIMAAKLMLGKKGDVSDVYNKLKS